MDQVISLLWSFCGAIFFLLSLLLHEFSHKACLLFLKKYNRKNVIFIFGSVQPNDLFSHPTKYQAITALCGPLASFSFVLCWYIIYIWASTINVPSVIVLIIRHQLIINLLIAVINSLPFYPLDNGIALRYVLLKKFNLSANRVIINLGKSITIIAILGGLFLICAGFFIAGIWCIIVSFSYKAALDISNQKELLLRSLYGESVSDYVRRNPITVHPSLTLDLFINDYYNRFHEKIYPVMQYSSVQGIVNLQKIKELPEDQWKYSTISEVSDHISNSNTVTADTDLTFALKLLIRTKQHGLLVVKNESLLGTITYNEIIHFLTPMINLPVETKRRKYKDHKKIDLNAPSENCHTKLNTRTYESVYNSL